MLRAVPGPQEIAAEQDTPMSAAGEVLIEVRGLKKRFGNFWAVRGVDLTVHAGEIVGLLGPNGAGKSTTIRVICGLLRATEGHVRVAGHDPQREPVAVKASIGYVTQHQALYTDLTVRENIRFYGATWGLGGARLEQAVDQWLERMGLEPFADQQMRTVPPGPARRAAFACAAIGDPPILVLDEPTSSVDTETSELIWDLSARHRDAGGAVLVTTHWMAEAERCDRVCIVAAGRIVGQGTPAQLRSRLAGRILGVDAVPSAPAVAALKAWPAARAVAVAGRWIRVEVDGDATAAADEAREVVEAAGARVRAVQPLEPLLDDVFVHLVTAGAQAHPGEAR